MSVRIDPADTPAEREKFLRLPWRTYSKDPHWIPPLISSERKLLDPATHPFHRHAQVRYFLARDAEGECVGRIAGIVNRAHLDAHRDEVGFWGFFETARDPEVAAALLSAAEGFLREQGMRSSRGPMNFSMNETCGLLVEGFDSPPYILMPHNPSWYGELVERAGYAKAADLLAYHITRETVLADSLRPAASQVEAAKRISFRHMDRSRLREEIKLVNRLFNDAWSRNWGFVPMTEAELEFMADELKPIFEPKLSYVASIGEDPIAFAVAIPNVNPILKRMGGRILPFGWIHMLLGRKSIDSFRVPLLGVRKDYQGSGIGILFCFKMIRDGLKSGARAAELSWILEDNRAMRSPLERIGATAYKRYRIYEKRL